MNVDFSPLNGWLSKKNVLPRFLCLEKNEDYKIEGWLSLDIRRPLYKVLNIPAQSLSDSWDECDSYIKKSLEIIDWDFDTTLDSDEVYCIKEVLGDPPSCCYPIYIITVGKNDNERIVYIGKTSSRTNRFKNGHKAALKLLNPIYEGLEKNIYLGTIVFWNFNEENYLPLEWIHPKEKALDILDSVESELIYNFKPEINDMKKMKNCSKYVINLHIQNFTKQNNFLDNKFIQNY